MKTVAFVFFLFCACTSFGQAASTLGGQAQQLEMSDHPQRASQHEMARTDDIYEHSEYSYAHGERPLWEFGPSAVPVPLGDIARVLRKQHALVKKADIIWEN
jgi:hypothetical protein